MKNTFITNRFNVTINENGARFDVSTSSKTGKKVTLCTLTGRITSPVLKTTVQGGMPMYMCSENFTGCFNGDITVRAKAVCAEGDTYDEETGKKVALIKAKIKLYNKLDEAIQKNYAEYAAAMQEYVQTFHKNVEYIVQNNKDYINTLCNTE